MHPSVKFGGGRKAWAQWTEMRVHYVAPDVMTYGTLTRVFAAQGRPEKALDRLEEITMMTVNGKDVLGADGMPVPWGVAGQGHGDAERS